ncbi:MAG: hypothetical protein NTV97_01015 [Alphaproteobacteria bacterium]|nr:hypothetical protein [Alphaproteobacteria bacterium]
MGVIAAFVAGNWRWLASLAAAAAAILLLMAVFHTGELAGKADDLKATIETQKRIDDADAHGPRTPDDVDKRLRDGKF